MEQTASAEALGWTSKGTRREGVGQRQAWGKCVQCAEDSPLWARQRGMKFVVYSGDLWLHFAPRGECGLAGDGGEWRRAPKRVSGDSGSKCGPASYLSLLCVAASLSLKQQV